MLRHYITKSSLRQDLVETHAFDNIINVITNFHVQYVEKMSCLIVGERNSRTGESKDYVENDNTGYVPVPDACDINIEFGKYLYQKIRTTLCAVMQFI